MPDGNAAADKGNKDGNWLLYHWITAGIVSASARFIPIPFVDDVVRDRCRRRIVSKTLMAHGQEERLEEFEAYYGNESSGCLTGLLTSAGKVPLKLLLFPLRKFVAIVTSVRGVPLEVTRSVLLGRTLHRILAKGECPGASQVAEMRSAFEQAFARMDLRTVRAVISDALRRVSSWKSAAIGSARELARGDDAPGDDIVAASQVQAGAAEVQSALQQPEILNLFSEFDDRFDRALSQLRNRPSTV